MNTPIPLVVTYEEAARMLGGPSRPVSIRYVSRLVATGKLKAVGSFRARRILYQSILDYLSREAA